MTAQPTVAGIGELLWDVFPDRKHVGGAPANFAWHTHQLGADSCPVSCVGEDAPGREIREALDGLGVDTRYVQACGSHPTGTVQVVLNAGKPTYQIRENVAWDHIQLTDDLRALAGRLDAACFGSLSQRSTESREAIYGFLRCMPGNSLKIFDVNLRQSYYCQEHIAASLEQANILKLNDEELPVLAEYFGMAGSVADQLEQLVARFDLRLVAYTRGPNGSVLVSRRESSEFPGLKCKAVDSVGAGDSFTAALCMGILRGWPLSKVNAFANEVATFVCSQTGATPALPARLVQFGQHTESETP